MYYAYNALLLIFSPLLALYLLARLAKGKSRDGWRERWGKIERLPEPCEARVWIHAASVGEVMAARPILTEYRALRPKDDIVMTIITPGGREVAAGMLGTQ